ncbi:hypothetical protein RDWZM_009569 [Blomia tropicalis]|uniref:Uncharacterized protein n=1 Tax=Blomia tropicalis TaxID=40697 RepID=A0A9Q0M5I6_BLOTA|nr:hypothetical protein BLOT_009326 [Blomia tropicalis]KAI2808150.1 hypothetical protein BLOT_006092 [Blomia tropicalis]KAJ6218412.1 hypothetical protein RDWZM_009569 [Blomia tropicalis]
MDPKTVEAILEDFQSKINLLEESVNNHRRALPALLKPADAVVQAWNQVKTILDDIGKPHNALSRLEEKIDNLTLSMKNDPKENRVPTYSSIVKKPAAYKTIIAKAKNPVQDNLNPTRVKEAVCNKLRDKVSNCASVTINGKGVVFNLLNEKSKNDLVEAIQNDCDLNAVIDTYEPKPKCPTIKVPNIDYSVAESELISTLCSRNPILNDGENNLKLLFTIKKKFYYDAILVISPHLFQKLMNSGDTSICTVWSASSVEETFLIRKCGNCLSFEHTTRDCPCKQEKACRKCGNIFSTSTTNNNEQSDFRKHIARCQHINCVSCSKDNLDSRHCFGDEMCVTYKRKCSALQRITCYDSSKIVTYSSSSSQLNQIPTNTQSTTSDHQTRIVTRSRRNITSQQHPRSQSPTLSYSDLDSVASMF